MDRKAGRRVRQIEEEAREDGERRAKKIVAQSIARLAGEWVAERSISIVALPSDDMKGRLIGREGRNLGKWWRETRFQAYQGVSMPYFPNYLSLASPYAFLGLNFFNTMEYQMRHMDRLFGELKRRGATTFEITEDANTRYLDRMTELLGDSLFINGSCATARSYYYNPAGEPTLLRPMSTKDAIREAEDFPITDYSIV